MKKFGAFAALLFFSSSLHAADIYKKVFNPHTGTFDFVHNLSSTSAGNLLDISTAGASAGNTYCWSFNGTVFSPAACPGGGASTLEVFSPTVRSSPTASINISNGLVETISGSTAIIKVDYSTVPSRSDVVLNQNTLQSGATFYVSSGTVNGQFTTNGAMLSGGNVHLGSGISNAYTYGIVATNGGQTTIANGDADVSIFPGAGANLVLTGDQISFSANSVRQPADTEINLKAVCLQDGTNCPASSNGGYALEPATVTLQTNKGIKTSTLTITNLGPGVLHTIVTSSNVVTALVSMSSETIGAFISSVNVSAALTVTANGANNTTITLGASASSTTLQGNTFNGASQLVQTNGSSLVPNANLDNSSVTKSGPLLAGGNITLTVFSSGTAITAAGGGSGTPGGSNTQVQYNNSSAFGGLASMTYYSSSNTITISSATNIINTSTVNVTDTFFNFTRSSVTIGQSVLTSTANVFQVGTSTTMAYTTDGHLEFHAPTAPTLSSCGSGPTITANSSDVTGTFTLGSGASATCTLTFSNAWKNTPQCFANDETSIVAVRIQPTTANVVFTVTGIATDTIDYFCVGEH